MKEKAVHGQPGWQGADAHYHNQGSGLAGQMARSHALGERLRKDVKQCGAAHARDNAQQDDGVRDKRRFIA